MCNKICTVQERCNSLEIFQKRTPEYILTDTAVLLSKRPAICTYVQFLGKEVWVRNNTDIFMERHSWSLNASWLHYEGHYMNQVIITLERRSICSNDVSIISFFWCNSPNRASAAPLLSFLDLSLSLSHTLPRSLALSLSLSHTHTHARTHARYDCSEWVISPSQRPIPTQTHNKHRRQMSVSSRAFESAFAAV